MLTVAAEFVHVEPMYTVNSVHCFSSSVQLLNTSCLCVGNCCLVCMQDDRQQEQASWMQRMVTSLFSDSTLFNTREGRAGKVHNFMLGLNLSTSIPLAPYSDVLAQNYPEDEADAVTGTE